MKKHTLLRLFPVILCMLLAFSSLAQTPVQRVPKPTPKPKPFPVYSKYKKRDTAKPNPYLIDTLVQPVPKNRELFHDNIDKEQRRADLRDGRTDSTIRITADSMLTAEITTSMINNVDSMQVMIENMPANGRDAFTVNQQKIRYLRAVWQMLRMFNNDKNPDAAFYNALEGNMHDMLIAVNENKLMAFAKANTNIYTLDNGKELFEEHPDVRAYVYSTIGKADPRMMIKRIDEYASDSFAGEIIKVYARIDPDLIFNFATSTDIKLKSAVFHTKDSLVEAIVKIATESKAPLKAQPFLSDIYHGRRTVAEVDNIADHPDQYYQALVHLRIEGDSIGKHAYTEELIHRSLRDYVREMNELHEAKDDVRFKCVDSMPATSLYYIMVFGQDEIYTSTFLGTFKRMMERMKPMRGNQLLEAVNYDHFRTFIRMCAGYNTLSEFLGTIDDSMKTTLMSNFIAGLQKGPEDDLEDAVDVADAFGSIKDSALAVFLQKKVKENYELSYTEKSKKGVIIYSLLARLFEGNKASDNDTGAAVTSSRLHLPPINKVPYKSLVTDSGIVYQQVFFYGDKDGQDSYESFMSQFKNKQWKINTEKYWSVISSVTGKKVVIYANLPLKEPEDEQAQDSLIKFLKDTGIQPTIIVHRGHSYHLPSTLSHLNKEVKVVILGSCGGYHNLALVLDRAPDAHIVSSKQTGVRAVNEPIIRALNARLVEGTDINWITIWRELEEYFNKNKNALDNFSDYVPPYKNLGAIFIKAYRNMMAAKTDEQPKN